MNIHVENKQIAVGDIRINGITGSSILLVGDTETIILSSITDTPPESLVTGPLVPLAPEG